MRLLFIVSLFMIFVLPSHSLAEGALQQTPDPQAAQEKQYKYPHEKDLAEMRKRGQELQNSLGILMKNLMDQVNDRERAHFLLIYNNHNIIQTVKNVRGDVGNAVSACSENHANLKAKLETRFEEWQSAVNAKIDEAEAQIENMTIAQDYTETGDIQKILDKSNDVRTHTTSIYEKVPVTSKEACDYLYEKMIETQDNLTRLLEDTLINVPEVLQRVEGEEEEPEPETKP